MKGQPSFLSGLNTKSSHISSEVILLFQKLLAFTKKVSDFADHVTGNAAANKAQFDAAPEELRGSFNSLIDALKSTASGDSGAKNIGATAIAGLTGTDVQSLLESLKSFALPTDWVTPAPQNNWINFDSTRIFRYRKVGQTLYVLGCVKGTGTPSNIIYNFPSDCRPIQEVALPAHVMNAVAEAKFLTSGDLYISNWKGGSADYVYTNFVIPLG
jgi:hypothetical protein